MTAALTLASEEDLPRLLPMAAMHHAEIGVEMSDEKRQDAIAPLLAGSPHGAIWLIGPRRAPVGYIALSFGWSIALGGMDGRLDAFYIREGVRGRGMGTEVLAMLLPELARAGLAGLSLVLGSANSRLVRVCERAGFTPDTPQTVMSWRA